jgi:predicted nuclease of predicted toxin-antitoxin system
MRFLVDNQLSPRLAALLNGAGHDAVHVHQYQMQTATDSVILSRAVSENRVLISADTDFSQLIALQGLTKPSVIAFNWPGLRQPIKQAEVILSNLAKVADDLEHGCILVIEETRMRVRNLPIGRD